MTGVRLELLYTIFAEGGVIARSARFVNEGESAVHLLKAMSLCLDLPDCDYDWIQFSGAWARERHVKTRRLEQGIQAVGSTRGHSSHEHNPFVILKRPTTDEFQGEAIGFSLVYSGNFLAQPRWIPTIRREWSWEFIRRVLTGSWSPGNRSRHRRQSWSIQTGTQ